MPFKTQDEVQPEWAWRKALDGNYNPSITVNTNNGLYAQSSRCPIVNMAPNSGPATYDVPTVNMAINIAPAATALAAVTIGEGDDSREVWVFGPNKKEVTKRRLLPLSDNEEAVFSVLPREPNAKQAKEIVRDLTRNGISTNIDVKEVSRICKRKAMRQRNVKNRPKVGYFIAE